MKYLISALICLYSANAFSDLADELEHLVGYVIIDSKTIKGWYDDDESEKNTFKGCRYGRVIVFTDSKVLTCAEYGYQYAYRPTAVILRGYRIRDFSPASNTEHDYEVEIPIKELAAIIRAVGAIPATDESANIVREAFISEVA